MAEFLHLIEGRKYSPERLTAFLDSLRENGVKELVFNAFDYEQELFFEPGFLGKYIKAVEKSGLKFGAAHGLWFANNDLNWPDADGRYDTVKVQCEFMHRAADSGCRIFILHPGTVYPRYSRSDLWQYVRESVEMLLAQAEKDRIVLALENSSPGGLGDDCQELAEFISGMNTSFLGVCFNACHAQAAGYLTESWRSLAPYATALCITDERCNVKFSPETLTGESAVISPCFPGTVITAAK